MQTDVVGISWPQYGSYRCDAFLEALGDPDLRVRILDKVPATMDEALRIALNLEVLDKYKETQKKATELREEPSDEEPRRRKEKPARLAVKSVNGSTSQSEAAQAMPTFAEVAQLKEALASCVQQMECMQKEFATRSQPAQPDTTMYQPSQYGVQPVYGQPTPGSMNSNPLRPRITNGQSKNGYRNLGPRRPIFSRRPPATCFTCRCNDHVSHYCPNNQTT